MIRNSTNFDVRRCAWEQGVCFRRLALALGISEPTLYRKLRVELADSEKKRFIKAIERLAKEG